MSPISHGQFFASQMLYRSEFNGRDIIHSSSLVSLGWRRFLCAGGGNGNPLQCSCLESPTDRGAWQATAHGVARAGHDLVTEPPPLQNYSRGWRDHAELSGIVLRTEQELEGTRRALLSCAVGHYQLDGEEHHGNSRLRSNGACQQKHCKQPKCGLSRTASFWLQEPQVHLGITDLDFQPLQWRKPHEKAGSIDPPHFSQELYCSLTSSLTAPTPPGPALYSHLRPILNSFPSLHITLRTSGQRTRWKTKAIL